MIADLFRSARMQGISLPDLRSRLRQWLEVQPPDHFLLLEPDAELRRIVAAEMQRAVKFPVLDCGLQDEDYGTGLQNGIAVALPNRLALVRQALPDGIDLLTLRFRSVPSSLEPWLPAPSAALVGIASRWPEFLKLAHTMLSAAGFHADSLVPRDARKTNWQRGLEQTAAVVCDSVTARELPSGCRAIPFFLIAESSIEELREYAEFICAPLESL